MIRRALLALVLLALPAVAHAQGNLFAMDGTGSFTTSTFNFDTFNSDSHVTMSRQTGICPTGGDAIRYVLVSDTVHSQPDWGHEVAVTDTVAQGAKRFYRIRIRFNGSTDFRGNNGNWYSKWNIFGSNAGRAIVHFGSSSCPGACDDTTPTAWVSKNVDLLPPNKASLSTTNEWNNVQFRMQSSSTTSATDGRVDTYVGSDNDSESTPTDSETDINLDLSGNGGADGWSNPSVGAGGFNQTTIIAAASVSMDICDVQYGTAFDTTWNDPEGEPPPVDSTPRRLRFRVDATEPMLWLTSLLGCAFVLARRRRADPAT